MNRIDHGIDRSSVSADLDRFGGFVFYRSCVCRTSVPREVTGHADRRLRGAGKELCGRKQLFVVGMAVEETFGSHVLSNCLAVLHSVSLVLLLLLPTRFQCRFHNARKSFSSFGAQETRIQKFLATVVQASELDTAQQQPRAAERGRVRGATECPSVCRSPHVAEPFAWIAGA